MNLFTIIPHSSTAQTLLNPINTELQRLGHSMTPLIESQHSPSLSNTADAYQQWIKNIHIEQLATMHTTYHSIKAAIKDQATSNNMILCINENIGARLAHEQLGIPLMSLVTQPYLLSSTTSSPSLLNVLPSYLPKILKNRLTHFGRRQVDDLHFAAEVNRFRQDIGLKPLQSIPLPSLLSPQHIIALFPRWFAKPQPDWPTQTHLTGFLPTAEAKTTPPNQTIPNALQHFLNAGEAPVMFAFTQPNTHQTPPLTTLIDACILSKQRALIIATNAKPPLPTVPDHIHYVDGLYFIPLLPHTAAIIHAGDINLMSHAFAAGKPQLMIPSRWDQQDNAIRLLRLDAGLILPSYKLNPQNLAKTLAILLQSKQIPAQCQFITLKTDTLKTLQRTCKIITQFGEQHDLINASRLKPDLIKN